MEYVRFGDLYSIPSSNGLSRPSAVRGTGYKMVNMGELFANGIISDIPMERVQMSDKELSKFLLEKGDLLFARQSLVAEGAGKCSYVNGFSEKTTFESHLIRVRLNPKKANSKYFYYLFQLQNNPIKSIVNQCAQAGIRGSELVRVKVPCPRIEDQQKIASILSAYDSQIENNYKRIKLLEQMAENLYKEWFVRFRFPGYESAEFEGGVPRGWKQVTLGDYADVIMGQSPESCFYNSEKQGLPFHQGCGSYGDFYLQDDIYSTEGKRLAESNSIIFSVRAPVGRINITLNKIILGRGVAGINAKNGNNAFLLWLLKNKFSKEDIIGNGSIFTSVTKDELLGQKLLIPSKEIEDKFNSIASNIEMEMRQLTIQKENLTRQRDLLLPRLMSGKLEVNALKGQ